MRRFFLLWFGQLISSLGSQMTGFALGVWVYQQTQSTTLFAVMMALNVIPVLLLMPLSGLLADRWNRRSVMLFSDLGSGICTLFIMIGLFLIPQSFPLWLLGLVIAGNAAFGAFLKPAYSAAITQLVPPDQLHKSSGMLQVSYSIGQLMAPILGGFLFTQFGLHWVLAIDAITFLLALLMQLMIKIPPIPSPPPGLMGMAEQTWKSELKLSWDFLRYRPALLSLVLFFTVKNLLTSMSYVLMTPYILSFAPVTTLGLMLSSGGIGMLVGGILLGLLPDRNRRIKTIYMASSFSGLILMLVAYTRSIPEFMIGSFLFFLALPFIHGSGQILFQRKVPSAIQGKVFAFNEALAGSSIPVGYLLAGPLSDHWFEPGMQPNGFLAPFMGGILGVGVGRGVALMFMIIGILHLLCAMWLRYHQPLRTVESKLPNF